MFFDADEWPVYLQKADQLGTWGDEITLRVAAEVTGIRIHVITSAEDNWYLVYEGAEGPPQSGREIFLTYVEPIHYNTMAPMP